nr:MAG TPA: hypothetical protein [Caudoviricetes sp.]
MTLQMLATQKQRPFMIKNCRMHIRDLMKLSAISMRCIKLLRKKMDMTLIVS